MKFKLLLFVVVFFCIHCSEKRNFTAAEVALEQILERPLRAYGKIFYLEHNLCNVCTENFWTIVSSAEHDSIAVIIYHKHQGVGKSQLYPKEYAILDSHILITHKRDLSIEISKVYDEGMAFSLSLSEGNIIDLVKIK